MCSKNRGKYWGAAALIFFGLIMLLSNFGLLPWGFWEFIWKLWPLVLIIPGIISLVKCK